MKILCVSTHKGGTGKTTISRLIAEYVARSGKRVLCIDLDSQCSLSQRFLKMIRDPSLPDGISPPQHPDYEPGDKSWDGYSSIADIFLGNEVVPYPTNIENLDILPAHGSMLRRIEMVTEDDVADRVHNRVREFLRTPEVASSYDLVVIDTAPSKGPLTFSAIRAATHVVIPTDMEPQGVEGLQGMIAMWRNENRMRKGDDAIKLIGILPNKFRQVAMQQGIFEVLASDESLGPLMIPHRLGLRTAFSETDHESARPTTIFSLPPKDLARMEAEQVGEYIAQKMEIAA